MKQSAFLRLISVL
ncbi:hypothetical protein AYI70_g2490, partial [Smittium culicis]